MNWQALQSEIALPGYAGMDDAAIAAAINAKVVTGTQHYYASARTIYGTLGPVKGKAVMDAIAAKDQTLYQIMLQVGNTDGMAGGIDVSLADTQAFMDQIITGGAMDANDKAALIALALAYTPWRQVALVQTEPVSEAQIKFARELEVSNG